MRRILIDDRIKKLAAEYVKKLPLVVGLSLIHISCSFEERNQSASGSRQHERCGSIRSLYRRKQGLQDF